MQRLTAPLNLGLGFLVGGLLSTVLFAGALQGATEKRERPDPDRARFLMECHFDYGLSYEDCERLLRSEKPVHEPQDDAPRC